MSELKQLVVSFAKPSTTVRWKRSNRVINAIKEFTQKKTHIANVKLSPALNEFVWSKGREHAPKKLPLLFHIEKEKVTVYLQKELEDVKKLIEKREKEKKKETRGKEKKKEEKKTVEEQKDIEEQKKKLEEKRAKENAFEKVSFRK